MKKYIRLYGGLGNQFFHYFLGQYLQNHIRGEIFFHFSKPTSSKLAKREMELLAFFPDIKLKQSLFFTCYDNAIVFRKLIFKVPLLKKLFRLGSENDIQLGQTATLDHYKYFIGYWQNLSLFNEVLASLIAKNWDRDVYMTMPEEVKQILAGNSVALHIRRDDYLKLPEIFHILDLDYYLRALKLISNVEEPDHIVVFSDDMSWCKAHINFPKIIFADWGLSTVQDFVAISRCKHKIIANSTFSLLASVLSGREGVIIAPKKWIKKGYAPQVD